MPQTAFVNYVEHAPNGALTWGLAWPRHPADPTNPTLWGPADAPLAHYPNTHANLYLARREHGRNLHAAFAYPQEWLLKEIATLAQRDPHGPAATNYRILRELWEILSPTEQEILRNLQNPAVLENLIIRLNLTIPVPPYHPNFTQLASYDYETLTNLAPGSRAYCLRINYGQHIYHKAVVRHLDTIPI